MLEKMDCRNEISSGEDEFNFDLSRNEIDCIQSEGENESGDEDSDKDIIWLILYKSVKKQKNDRTLTPSIYKNFNGSVERKFSTTARSIRSLITMKFDWEALYDFKRNK